MRHLPAGQMDLGIKGETALCIGSTQGLGYGCAEALAAAGCKVVINGRNEERGKLAAKTLGATFVAADVSMDEERLQLLKAARKELGHISILVTNSDGPPAGPFLSKTLDDWRAAFELAMLPAIDLAARCVEDMAERGFGRIINISSTFVKEPRPDAPLACAVKLGLIGALASLAREVAHKGITVNSVLPGPFDTAQLRRNAPTLNNMPNATEEEATVAYGKSLPVGRLGTIKEFGALCAFIASRHAGFMTGQSVVLDGGRLRAIY